MKHRSVIFHGLMVWLVLSLVSRVRGQSRLDGFDPNANGAVSAVVVQADGRILIGGSFTTLTPNSGVTVTANGIARLKPDGTHDSTFDPNANGTVLSIAVQADGMILAGGDFTTMGGQPRNRIARLNPNGTPDTTFDPNANGTVYSIAVQADGEILAGGDFTIIGGQTRSRIARLDPVNRLVDSFNPNADSTVTSIAVQADGRILAGGSFTGIGGLTRNRIARLDPASGLADSFNPNADNSVTSIAVQADGKILAGGNFTGIGGQTRNRIARFDSTTGLADSFNPDANFPVASIVVQADGRILAGGDFTSIGGQTRNRIARLDATTGLADSFDPNANGDVRSIAVQADGKILACGVFNGAGSLGGQTRNYIARLETDGRIDQTLDLGAVAGNVDATAVQPDGKIVIGGYFSSILGEVRKNIARLNTDGTLDMAFDPNADEEVDSIAVQADGKILVGGPFTNIGGQPRNHIARLDPATGLADSFNPNADVRVNSIVVQTDGKILVSGNFSSIGGQPRNTIARLDPATGLADSFDPNPDNAVAAIAVQADGKILAGGYFTSIGGQARYTIARLDPATGLADAFHPIVDPRAYNAVYAITVQADGKILVGGRFISIGGQPRNHIARLYPATGLADSFAPNADDDVYSIAVQTDGKILVCGHFESFAPNYGLDYYPRSRIARLNPDGSVDISFGNLHPDGGLVYSVAVLADGKILAGGSFTSIGWQPRNLLARLTNDTPALQNLTATPSTVTWTRGGASPLLARVTFELSTDHRTYTPLGDGTAAGSGWTLGGLSLPVGQNFYLRARGYYASGFSGSESITESVRNAFLGGGAIARSGDDITITYDAVAGRTYRLERKLDLADPAWAPIPGVADQTPVASGRARITHPGGVNQARAFYLVRLLP